jgi:hypothetical protein
MERRSPFVSYSNLVRWCATAFALSGAAWIFLGLSTVAGILQAIPGREDVVLFIAAHVFLAAGLAGLHALQKDDYGALGRVGLYITLVAISARVLGAVVFLAGSVALEWISPPATAGMLAGLVLYGLATLRAGTLPRWHGVALIVAMPISFPLAEYGTTLFGAILTALGCALWLRRGIAANRPRRVA